MSKARVALSLAAGLLPGLLGCAEVKVQPPALAQPARHISFEIEEALLPSVRPLVSDGEQVYRAGGEGRPACASCHGADGQPKVAGAPDFSTPEWIRDKSPIELLEFVSHGPGHAYGEILSLQQRWDVLAYCRFLAVDIEAIRAAKTGLFGKNCNVCHGNNGYGNGFLAPTMQPPPRNLTDYQHWGTQRTDREIFDNIWYGVHWSAMPPWRDTLSADEVWGIVDFIRSLQYQPPAE